MGMPDKQNLISHRASVNWIVLIYFFSGVCSLMDEVIWVRLLKLVLGNTVYASSVVVSVFMGGLALGSLIMSRWADRVKNHLRLYGLLELLITISAVSVPWALNGINNGYVWFYRSFDPSPGVLLAVQVVFSTIVLLIPSMLMGSTLPLLGRFVTAMEDKVGHLVGRLYALNMLGAALGCFLAGFICIRSFGVMNTLYIAAGLNLFVSFGGWFLSFHSKISTEEVQAEPISEKIAAAVKQVDARFYVLVIALFMSGLISIAYEIIWMRSVVHLLGGATYVFSAVLTVYLLGNVIGVGIGSKLSKRLKAPAVGFAVSLSILGVLGFLYLPYFHLISDLLDKVGQTHILLKPAGRGIWSIMSGLMTQNVLLFILPSVVMGIGFPMALQAWAYHFHKVGKSTGTAYSANTIGAILGGIVTGFVFIPLMGVRTSIMVFGLMGLWIGCVMFLFFLPGRQVIKRLAYTCVAVCLTFVAIRVPQDSFHKIVSVVRSDPLRDLRLLGVKEGITTTVTVHIDLNHGTLQQYASGQELSGEDLNTRCDQKMLGHMGALLNPNAKDVLTIGFGSGETTKCLSMHNLRSVDCVEIAREVPQISLEYFSHINLGDRLDEEINMIYMDAKNYIHLTDKKYDVIVNDSIHPTTFAENSSLYGKEFFEDAKSRLNENGIMFIWIPYDHMPIRVLHSIVGTLMDVFPHVSLWYSNYFETNYFWAVASKQYQKFSPKHIDNELLNEDISQSLAEIKLNNSLDILSYYLVDERGLRNFLKEYETNSDYFPFVEFITDPVTPDYEITKNFILKLRDTVTLFDHIDWSGFEEEDKNKWLDSFAKIQQATEYVMKVRNTDDLLERLDYIEKGLKEHSGNPSLLKAKADVNDQLLSMGIRRAMSKNPQSAASLAAAMLRIDRKSGTAEIIMSAWAQMKGDAQKALSMAQKAVESDPKNANTHKRLGNIYALMSEPQKAIKEYETCLQIEPDRFLILGDLANILVEDKNSSYYDPGRALELAEKSCKLTYFQKTSLVYILSRAYAASGDLEKAIETGEMAIRLARAESQDDVAESISDNVNTYKNALGN